MHLIIILIIITTLNQIIMKAVLNKVNGLTLKNKVAIVTIPFITYLAVRVVIEAITNGTSI